MIVTVPEWLFRSRILNEGVEKANASMAFPSLFCGESNHKRGSHRRSTKKRAATNSGHNQVQVPEMMKWWFLNQKPTQVV